MKQKKMINFVINGNSLIVENEGLHCECGAEITEEDKFCGKCGKRLNENEVIKNEEVLYCKICNSVVDEKDNYCLSCGSKLKEDVDIISSNKRTCDSWLCFSGCNLV